MQGERTFQFLRPAERYTEGHEKGGKNYKKYTGKKVYQRYTEGHEKGHENKYTEK